MSEPPKKREIGLDLGPQSARMPIGNEIEFEGEGAPIELDVRERQAPPSRVVRPSRAPRVVKPKRRWPFVVLFILLAGGGGALLEKTEYGAFFRHPIDAFRHAEERALLARQTMDRTRDALAADTLDRGNEALLLVASAVERAPRHKPLLAWAAYVMFAHELRFGRDRDRHDRAIALLSRAGDHPHAHLAAAARELLNNDRTRARAELGKAPDEVEAKLLLGAIELADKHPRETLTALEDALKLESFRAEQPLESSVRTRAALVRALEATEALRALPLARDLARDAPAHVGVRLVLGRLAIATRDVPTATKCVAELQPLEKQASRAEQSELETLRALVAIEHGDFVGAEHLLDRSVKLAEGLPSLWTMIALGDVELHAGKRDEAHAHYDAALAIDPSATRAVLGLARALIASGHYEEARKLLDTIRDASVAPEVAKLRTITMGKALKSK